MNRLAIRILTLAMLSLTLTAAPVVSVVYAAPDNDPPPPDKKKKKSSEARPGIEQTAFADGYRAAYAAIYDRHDYTSAITQLKALSGRTVTFHTGVALCDADSGRCRRTLVDVVSTFRVLAEGEIEDYLRRERPYDCAGAVRSERLGIVLFERIASDDPTALIGLPLIALVDLLRAEGVDVLARA